MKNLLSLMGMLALAGSFMLPSHAMAADKTRANELPTLAEGMIGEVTFLFGQAEVTLPDGTVLPLDKNMEIPDGSRVLVRKRSILRLTLADGGREKLGMPEGDTVFIFNKYAYDPANPQATQIRKTIVDGEVTSKTGEGGEKAKTRYRLNTPLAAIAVLGTEYTVRVVQGQTWVTVKEGEISIAKLGGSCQVSGLGACVGGERLSENQRGLALVVRSDQPRPVFVPVTAVPGARNSAASSQSGQDDAEESSEDAAKSDEKTADKSADKATDKTTEKSSGEKTADKQAETDKGDVKSAATTEKIADKTTDKTVATEKTADKASPVTTEKTPDKTVSTSAAPDKTTKTVTPPAPAVVAKVDERDFLAVESPPKTTTVEEKKQETVTPVTATVTDAKQTAATSAANVAAPASVTASVAPIAVSSSSSTGNTALVSNSSAGSTAGTATLESKQTDSSATTAVLESKQPLVTSTPTPSVSSSGTGLVSNSSSTPSAAALVTTPVLESTKPALLVSPGSDPISGSVVTTSNVTPVEVATPLVSSSDGLVETSKTEATLTTDAGEVVAAVTPAPAEPVTPATPTTPAVDPATQPVVRWDKYDPAAMVDAATTQGDQVSSLYEQLLQTALGGYVTERQKTATAVLPEQRDVTFALGSYEANVNNAVTGVKTSATIGDAHLSVSSTRNTYDTGFTLTSPAYTGSITSTGTFSSVDGTLKDDGTNPQTRLSGAVGVVGESIDAAYVFTHQIDPLLSAEGALNWTGSLVPASSASVVPVSPTTATVAVVAPVAGTAIAD